jgi:hypothetical protein
MEASMNFFTPVFGGKPDLFFGRESIVMRFQRALTDRGSDYRALFITGSRGYGKTALLEQLSIRAKNSGMQAIDASADRPIQYILRALLPYDEESKTVDPSIQVSVAGIGGAVKTGSRTRSTHYSQDDFQFMFLAAAEKSKGGIFLSIDEVQKVSIDDMSVICGAFQMASRKGYNVMLAIAGLPYSFDKIVHHDGCTFMRRAAHVELGPMGEAEVRQALLDTITGAAGFTMKENAQNQLIALSKGHPYIIQLLGFYLMDHKVAATGRSKKQISEADVTAIWPKVLETYNARALAPLVEEMSAAQVAFLRAMANVVDEERLASVADIAAELNRSVGSVSSVRAGLVNNGIIISPKRGKLAFMIPYLADFIQHQPEATPSIAQTVTAWKM